MTVGIVGGGVTGLAVHHYLRESGVDSVVFEADDEPGGVIRSRTVEGRVLSVHRLERGMPAYDRSWTALDRVSVPEGVRLCTNSTARAGIPGRIREAKRVAEELATEFESRERPKATPPRTP